MTTRSCAGWLDSGTPLIVAADSVGVGNALSRQGPQNAFRPPSLSQYGCRPRQSA